MKISVDRLNPALQDKKTGVMNFLNEIAIQYPDAISFAPGRPLEQFFDVESSLSYIQNYVNYSAKKQASTNNDTYNSLGQYSKTNGVISELLAELLKNDDKVEVHPDNIVTTVGCQEAMCLCLLALAGSPNDVVLTADPVYIGISGAAQILGIEIVAIPADEGGIDLTVMREIINDLLSKNKTPRFLYLSPDFANPSGITTSLDRRKQLLALTQEMNLLILEDHAYNYFNFDADEHGSLKRLPNSGHVIYLGSFSKSVYPGVRVGFIASDLEVTGKNNETSNFSLEISKVKSLLTVNTSPLCQAIIGGILLINNCSLKSFVSSRQKALHENRDALLMALEANFPKCESWCKDISWNKPSGGFFLSLKLPFLVSDDDLALSAQNYGVLWTPMSYFYLEQEVSNEIRLSFSYVTLKQIEIGIAKLANMLKAKLAQ